MTDIATRVASLLDDRLLDLHKALDAGDPQNPADVEAHHLVAVEMLRRGHQHGHTEDPWATAAIVTDEVQVDGPDDIEAPEGLSVAWEGALSKGGTVSIVLTTDGYVLKAQPSVNEVHHVEEPEGTDPGEPEGTDPGEPVEKSWDDADVLTALTSEDRAWFATVATVLDSGGDPDLLVAKGNPEPLRDYWRKGGNGKVNWGAGGDFTSCAAAVSKYMTSEEAKGYCAIRHRETTGMWPGDKRNRAQKAAADMTGILTLPDGSTYTFSPEPVAKHGSPGRPGYSQLHGGGSGGGAPRATAVDIKSGTASSNALPKAAQKRLRQELNRGTLVDTYGSSFERGREHKTGRDRHGEPITTSGGGDPVRHHREQRDSALATLDAMPLRSGASDSWAAKVATHQGFIDGATGARPMFPRSHTFGETLSGILFGGLSGATKAADLVEAVEKHGDPSRPGYSQLHGGGGAGGSSLKDKSPRVGGALTDSSRTYPIRVQRAIDSKPRVIDTEYGQIDDTMSAWHHMVADGQGGYAFTPERQAIHERIIEGHLAGVMKNQPEPVMVIMGGGGGSGKGTLIESGLLGDSLPSDRVHIDADEIKMQLPEYDSLVRSGHKTEVANYVHEESSILSKALQKRAEGQRSHIVLDGTGDSNEESLRKKITAPRAKGYTVRAEYVSAPISTGRYDPPSARGAWERNVERAASGPRGLVVPSAIISAHTSVSRLVPSMAGEFDSFRLWDTTNADGGGPVLMGTATRGSRVTVLDAPRYQTFLAKGRSTVTPDALMSTITTEQWDRIRSAV